MGRFKSVGQAQRFLAAFEPIREHFHPQQHKQTASEYREVMRQQIESWRIVLRTGYAVARKGLCEHINVPVVGCNIVAS